MTRKIRNIIKCYIQSKKYTTNKKSKYYKQLMNYFYYNSFSYNKFR